MYQPRRRTIPHRCGDSRIGSAFFVLYHIRCRTPRIVQCREWWLCLLRWRSFWLPYLQVLEFYKYHTLFKSLFRVADLALFYPKVVFAEAIDEVFVKVATKGICRYCFPQFLFVFRKHYAVYQFKDCFTVQPSAIAGTH